MTYVVVRKRGQKGSFAYLFTTDLIGFVSNLQMKYCSYDIQVVGVSNFDVYSEYEPVVYVNSPEELEDRIKEIID